MYWTDYGTVVRIERASMDGALRTNLHTTELSAPYGLTIDYDTQTLYWVDYSLDKLEKSNTDGTNRTVVTRASVQCPWGITFFENKLYWSDICQHVIYTASIDTPNNVSTLISTGSDPYRLHVISKDRQPLSRMNVDNIIISFA